VSCNDTDTLGTGEVRDAQLVTCQGQLGEGLRGDSTGSQRLKQLSSINPTGGERAVFKRKKNVNMRGQHPKGVIRYLVTNCEVKRWLHTKKTEYPPPLRKQPFCGM